ncbi:MAG TPA: bifunctional hydroxymethylpyrimidine kinase/phosphomethylpyrimidine kinase [Acidobacteriaceae bacterium]|nr:bifunctional hydroxymethylpyrimidine kinase/phosphomethylpyrimidine kinase [Acidobacteriaceae bacterium]
MCTRPVALSIAGFDPSSGAGITADLKTFAAHRIYGVACISALTVQSTLGVRTIEPLSPNLVRETLDCLTEDITISGIKIGMLGDGAVAGEIAAFLARQSGKIDRRRIVLDPIVKSSSGAQLIDANGIRILRDKLLASVGWITPNVQELAVLAGEGLPVPVAASRLVDMAATQGNAELNVVVTGGDLDQPNDFLLGSSGEESWFQGEKVVTSSTHGTGCAFSSALLCALILGESPQQAVHSAKAYVTEGLRTAYPVGKGKGPINHLFRSEK